MKKLLFYGDTPTGRTGFSNVSKNILKRLHATGKYEISVLGINYFGEPHDLPYKIYPAIYNSQNDVYGRQKLIDLLRNTDNEFDVLFTLQDTFIMATIGEAIKKIKDGAIIEKEVENNGQKEIKKVFQPGRGFKWVYYYPIDCRPEKEWITKSVALADVAVPYTKYAEKESKSVFDRKYEVIYHGFDKNTFHPISEKKKKEFKDKFFKDNNLKNAFLIVNVNRNQTRKGMLQTLIAFKHFNSIIKNSVLYTHCNVHDKAGHDMIKLASKIGLTENWLYPNPKHFEERKQFSDDFINSIYNIADINLSTTLGEGFGLSMAEGMACKTINVFPDNTAINEILKEGRGVLVKSGNTPNNLISCGPIDNNQIRPVVDIHDLVGKLLWVYSHPEQKKEVEEKAYKWAQKNLDWDKIGDEWDNLISNLIK
jgi:glycosyltransferase involved in cell wall biosynthesis